MVPEPKVPGPLVPEPKVPGPWDPIGPHRYSPNSLSDWGPGGFFKGSMEGLAPMVAGVADHFCLKNQ